MNFKQTPLLLISIMAVVISIVAGSSVYLLYQSAFEQQRARLIEVAQSRGRLIEAVARFDAEHSQDAHPAGAEAATLGQIADAHGRFQGFGDSGEFTLAKREGGNIVFLLSHRHFDLDMPKPVAFGSELAEPMRRALKGLSGTLVGLDYRGEQVLAAHEPLAEVGWGIVAKIDVAEVRAPFVKAGLVAVASAFLMILLGSALFLRVTRPVIRRLESSESRYRTLFGSSDDAIAIIDDSGFVDCNPAMLDLFVCPDRQAFQRCSLTDLVPGVQSGAQTHQLVKQYRSALASSSGCRFECELQRIGGQPFYAEILLSPMQIEGCWLIQMVVRDVSARKRIQQALQASEEYNRMLFEESMIGLALCHMDGTLVDVNPAYAAILGRTVKEALKLSYWEITPKKYLNDEQYQLDNLEKYGRYGPYEKEYIHKDGHLVPVQLSGSLIKREGERFIWSCVEDISERKGVESKLRQAATVFDNTDEGIVITDVENRIISVNKAFTELTGYSAEEVLGQNPNIQKSGHHGEDFYHSMWEVISNQGQWRGEIWNRRKSGELYPAWQNISAVKNERSEVTNYVSIFSDISVIKEKEAHFVHLAHHDALTGLPNRLCFMANLDQVLQRAMRYKQRVGLLFLDLNGFKDINDSMGHACGDMVLQNVAERLLGCVRAEDTVARLGGDEFAIILAEISDIEDVERIADKAARLVAESMMLGGKYCAVSTSIGASIFPDDADVGEDLIKAADGAMYAAKKTGSKEVQFFACGNGNQYSLMPNVFSLPVDSLRES